MSRVGGAPEWMIGQWPAAPVGPKEKKGEYCHKTEYRRQCLKCQEYVRQRSETYKRQRKRTGTTGTTEGGTEGDPLQTAC